MDYIAEILIEKEYIEREEFERLMREPIPEGGRKGGGGSPAASQPEQQQLTETLSPVKLGGPQGTRQTPSPGLTFEADRNQQRPRY
jgi:hypothetical protein